MRHPLLYQINTRVLLGELGRTLGRRAALDDLPDDFLDGVAARGFEWVWPLGVWQTGPAGTRDLPDPTRAAGLRTATTCPTGGTRTSSARPSPCRPTRSTGTSGATPRWPGCASGWPAATCSCCSTSSPTTWRPTTPGSTSIPSTSSRGPRTTCAREPQNWGRFATSRGPRVLAFGRDPYFPGLARRRPAQLPPRRPPRGDAAASSRASPSAATASAATWPCWCSPRSSSAPGASGLEPARRPPPDRPAVLARRHRPHRPAAAPDFVFIAEVYWDMEWELQQAGFDYTYDKRLYDRLVTGPAGPGARAPAGGPGLPGPLAALPREPRRAPGGCDLRAAGPAQGGRGHHLLRARAALLSRR